VQVPPLLNLACKASNHAVDTLLAEMDACVGSAPTPSLSESDELLLFRTGNKIK
jgi:hypothetical protein